MGIADPYRNFTRDVLVLLRKTISMAPPEGRRSAKLRCDQGGRVTILTIRVRGPHAASRQMHQERELHRPLISGPLSPPRSQIALRGGWRRLAA